MNTKELIKKISQISKKPEHVVEDYLKRMSQRTGVPYEETVKIYYTITTGEKVI